MHGGGIPSVIRWTGASRLSSIIAQTYEKVGCQRERGRCLCICDPEYNYGPPPSLSSALNYVYREWNYKPAGIVSYGGGSGGETRGWLGPGEKAHFNDVEDDDAMKRLIASLSPVQHLLMDRYKADLEL